MTMTSVNRVVRDGDLLCPPEMTVCIPVVDGLVMIEANGRVRTAHGRPTLLQGVYSAADSK